MDEVRCSGQRAPEPLGAEANTEDSVRGLAVDHNVAARRITPGARRENDPAHTPESRDLETEPFRILTV